MTINIFIIMYNYLSNDFYFMFINLLRQLKLLFTKQPLIRPILISILLYYTKLSFILYFVPFILISKLFPDDWSQFKKFIFSYPIVTVINISISIIFYLFSIKLNVLIIIIFYLLFDNIMAINKPYSFRITIKKEDFLPLMVIIMVITFIFCLNLS